MAYYGAPIVDDDCQPHFLEACFLCSKPLGDNSEIFMYRGNTPFCSKDCREEQIEFDEAKERKNRNANSSSSNNKSSSSEAKDSTTTNSIWTASLAVAY